MFNDEEWRKDEGICIPCEIKEERAQQKNATKSKNASIEKIVSAQNEELSDMNKWKAAKNELQQLRAALKVEKDEEKKSGLSIRIAEVKKRKEELGAKIM